VHLGGGTPTYLGPELLTRLVERCRSRFAVTAGTELALESTVGDLTPAMLDAMDALGIRRLHVGVQSLDDGVRATIGRRDPARDVMQRIETVLERGWIVSADLICGLPGQATGVFVADIERLVAAGVDGFSLYELLIYRQNRAWADAHGLIRRSHVPNYVNFLAGAQVLDRLGFAKNTFNHWADDRDANVYFTSPTRDEDCLAVGTIADGVISDYHFRHPRFAAYLRGAGVDGVGLEGGLRRTVFESRMRPLVTAILSNHIPAPLTETIDVEVEDREPLTEIWLERRLVDRDRDDGLTLTASGAWFAGNMVSVLTGTQRG
jgi:coproporphyrinogen III oxidase-like Fe-S oxidoreductase